MTRLQDPTGRTLGFDLSDGAREVRETLVTTMRTAINADLLGRDDDLADAAGLRRLAADLGLTVAEVVPPRPVVPTTLATYRRTTAVLAGTADVTDAVTSADALLDDITHPRDDAPGTDMPDTPARFVWAPPGYEAREVGEDDPAQHDAGGVAPPEEPERWDGLE